MKYIVMNTGKSESLYKDYLEGLTSLEQEEMLRAESDNLSKGDQLWLDYQKDKMVETPAALTYGIKQSLASGSLKRKRTLKALVSAAAAVGLIISIWFFSESKSKEMPYAEKLVALTEARMLLEDQAEAESEEESEEIIYEDESIIIYLK